MRSQKTIKNFKVSLLMTVLTIFLAFFSRKIFIDQLGKETTGLMQLFAQMLGYLNLAELGLGTAATYSLYKPLVEQDYKRLNVVISTMKSFYRRISLSILCIGLILTVIVPFFAKTDIPKSSIYVYWMIYVINAALSYQFAHNMVLLTADQRFYKVKIIEGITKITTIFIQIVIIYLYKSLLFYVLIDTLSNIGKIFFYRVVVKTGYNIESVKDRDRELTKNIGYVFFHKISGILVFHTDYILISKFLSLTAVTMYGNYLIIGGTLDFIINGFCSSITASVGNYIAEKGKKASFNIWQEFYAFFFFLSTVITYITYKTISPFIILWLGEDLVLSNYIVLLLMVNLFILITRKVTEMFKFASGFFDDIHLALLEGFINLAVSLFLVVKIGLPGVVWGTITSNIVVVSLLRPILVFKRVFGKKMYVYLIIFMKYLVMALSSMLIVEKLLYFIPVFSGDSYITWLLMATEITLVSGLVSLAVFLLDESFRKNLLRLFFLIKKRFGIEVLR